MIQALLGHEKLETTARYARVATGLISKIESPLDGLSVPRRKRARRTLRRRRSPRPWLDQLWRSRTFSAIIGRF